MDALAVGRLAHRVEAALEQAQVNLDDLAAARSRLRQTRQVVVEGRQRRAVLHESAYARLEARLASMPTIEQAKGVIMAQTGCGPDEAFQLLKKASQRANVKVRDLAAEIVGTTNSAKGFF
jgi:AmiR/NasT family two-component response regulator